MPCTWATRWGRGMVADGRTSIIHGSRDSGYGLDCPPLALRTHIDHFDAHLAYIGVAAAGLASTDSVPPRSAQCPESSGSRNGSHLSRRSGTRSRTDRPSADLSTDETHLRWRHEHSLCDPYVIRSRAPSEMFVIRPESSFSASAHFFPCDIYGRCCDRVGGTVQNVQCPRKVRFACVRLG